MAYTYKHGDRPLDDFTIQRAVGSGGFGEVYYALSDGGREVALKYLKTNPQVELRGVSHCINLKSPHLVSIFDVKKNSDDDYFIIMEYCSGPSLRDLLIAEPNGFEPQKAAFFVREIAKGLSYLHDRGIVHRDLKPGNIFYDDGYVKIGDYGLSKFISISRHSAQTASVGTVHYMAPEIGSGNYSRGVDIYALGVMLYEMLLGKVPFEGSSMAEVLMKHLTAQPELDELPHPYGDVIRKTLEKDPNDRYQSVDEMIETLLDVDDIKKSLAGFRTQSLDGAVRRGGPDKANSPIPSPNPTPGWGKPPAGAPAGGYGANRPSRRLPIGSVPLPDHLAKKFDRISRKVEQRMAKMASQERRPFPSAPRAPGTQAKAVHHRLRTGHLSHPHRAVPFLLTIGMGLGFGLLVGGCFGDAESGAAAGLLTVAMSGGVVLSRSMAGWFRVPFTKGWLCRTVHACCCAPLLAIGAAPLLATTNSAGLAVWIGLLVVATMANWPKHFERAESGNMSFGSAIWLACGALFASLFTLAIFKVPEEPIHAFIAAGVAGIAGLVVQSTGSWLSSASKLKTVMDAAASPDPASGAPSSGRTQDETSSPPFAQPVAWADGTPAARLELGATHIDPSVPRQRWGITRAFWGIVSFALIGGVIVTFILTLVHDGLGQDDRTGMILGCIACASVMLFSIRKTTPIKQFGFWRETIRPALITIGLFGIGSTTTAIARHWSSSGFNGEERGGIIVALVFSSLLFLIAAACRGRRRKPGQFLVGCSAEDAECSDADPGEGDQGMCDA